MSIPKAVTTIGEFTEWVEQVGNLGTKDELEVTWYRGVGRSTYKLLPGLYRSKGGLDRYTDDELRVEFSRRAMTLLAGRAPRDKWEWYCLMQHYRVPTRLLDWTDAALVALYFALSAWQPDPKGKKSRPAVWAMKPEMLNSRTEWEGTINTFVKDAQAYLPNKFFEESRIPKLPIAVDPPLIAPRMLVQHSHFTIHGSDSRGLDEMHEIFGRGGLTKVRHRPRPGRHRVYEAAPCRLGRLSNYDLSGPGRTGCGITAGVPPILEAASGAHTRPISYDSQQYI